MKTYLLVAMHGDEQFGLKVAGKVQQDNPDVLVRIGHPEAVAKRVRYIESDLNRSFSPILSTLEASLAKSIRQETELYDPDYIIDVHCSYSDVGKIGIVAEINPTTIYLAQSLGMEAIVRMPNSEGSFIGCFSDKAISIEYGKNHRSDKLAQDIAHKIKLLKPVPKKVTPKVPIYEVFGTIEKNFKGLAVIKNLHYNQTLNGYPFLAGPTTYKHIGGYLAKKIESATLSVNTK